MKEASGGREEVTGWNEGKIESVESFRQTWRVEDVIADCGMKGKRELLKLHR